MVVWRFLRKLGIKPPYDPAIPLLGIYPEETKLEKDICIPLFKQPRYPLTDEEIKTYGTDTQWNIVQP